MNVFIPLVLVCYMGSGCVTGYHYQAEFDTYDECVNFIMDGWKEDVISSFDVSKIAGVILTKTDESLSLGSALSVIIEHNIPISYVASGQRVPEDIALADPNKISIAP